MILFVKQSLNVCLQLFWLYGRVEALDYIARSVNEEFLEVPLDVALLTALAVDARRDSYHDVHQHIAFSCSINLLQGKSAFVDAAVVSHSNNC